MDNKTARDWFPREVVHFDFVSFRGQLLCRNPSH